MSTAKRRVVVDVKREDFSYPIVVCPGRASSLSETFGRLGLLEAKGAMGRVRRRACVLVDATFGRARPDVVKTIKRVLPPKDNLYLRVPGTEASKSLSKAGAILGEMIAAGFTRNDFCLAIGGGVVGDLGGFVASLYHRGIDVVHMPTTLLAMVDSSIGGKTAVNHPQGKNLIGTFHQPAAVVVCPDFLETLPDSEFLSGLGEVFKYAVGFSREMFDYLDQHFDAVLERQPRALERLLVESASIKAAVVGRDERETGVTRLQLDRSGGADRRLLNLGHTIGHGIEKAYALPHGVAIAMGVTIAAKISSKLQLCPLRCFDRTMDLATKLTLKTEADLDWSIKHVLPYVRRDKKMVGGRLQFVCLKDIGQAVVHPIGIDQIEGLLE